MVLTIIFLVSGACILLLLFGKVWEQRNKRPFVLLGFISNGDRHVREWSQIATHEYAVLKEDAEFFLKKQFPLHARNFINKTETLVRERTEKYVGDLRNTKLLKPKNEGISEFFKNISERENGDALSESDPEDKIL